MIEFHAMGANEQTAQLGWNEICATYPDEWVVLVDYCVDDNEKVVAGRVYAHAPRKAQIRREMAEPQDAAILWTGRIVPMAGVMVRFDDDKV